MKITSDHLMQAADLIGDETKWTRNTLARDRSGTRVQAANPEAVTWCAIGALVKVSGWPVNAFLSTPEDGPALRRIVDRNDNVGRLEAIEALKDLACVVLKREQAANAPKD